MCISSIGGDDGRKICRQDACSSFTRGFQLPRCLLNAGDLALIGALTEADTADAEITQVSMGSAADLAAVVAAGGELVSSLLLQNHSFSCHS